MTITTTPSSLRLDQFLRAGDRIVWGQGCGEPETLMEALMAQGRGIGGLSAFATTSFSKQLSVGATEAIRFSSMGAMGSFRALAAAGKLGIVPCHIGQVGAMIDDGLIGCDVAFVQVSPADAQGNHSYGLSSDHIRNAVGKARVVIAEVNEQVPFTLGDVVLPAARIDCAVHVSRTPVEVASAPPAQSDQAIARHVAEFIGDGAVLEVGIGAVPDGVMRLLLDRRDLGFHSGMASDALVDLVEAGVITNARKPFDQGVSIAGVLIGTRRLFEWAHRNPLLGMRGPDYTHGEPVLTRIPGLVTINSALEVDLTGQVNAEQSGDHYLGGTGGQVDFVRGGARAPGGRSVIALPSTAKGGKLSRIVATLSGPVTTARSEVDVIVTEYGAAELKGQTLAERTRRMIAIAHPDFRETLDRASHQIRQRGF